MRYLLATLMVVFGITSASAQPGALFQDLAVTCPDGVEDEPEAFFCSVRGMHVEVGPIIDYPGGSQNIELVYNLLAKTSPPPARDFFTGIVLPEWGVNFHSAPEVIPLGDGASRGFCTDGVAAPQDERVTFPFSIDGMDPRADVMVRCFVLMLDWPVDVLVQVDFYDTGFTEPSVARDGLMLQALLGG